MLAPWEGSPPESLSPSPPARAVYLAQCPGAATEQTSMALTNLSTSLKMHLASSLWMLNTANNRASGSCV